MKPATFRDPAALDYVHLIAKAYKEFNGEEMKRLFTEAMDAGIKSRNVFDPLKRIYGIGARKKTDKNGEEYVSIRKGPTGREARLYSEKVVLPTSSGPDLNKKALELAAAKAVGLDTRIKRIMIGENEGTLADRVMLIDASVEKGEGDGVLGSAGEGHTTLGTMGEIIRYSPRYVLDQRVCNLINEIAHDSSIAAFEHTKTPCGSFWVEYQTRSDLASVHVGVLYIGDEDQDNPHPELDGLPTIEAAVKSMVSDSSLEKGNLFIFLQVAGMVSTYVIPVTMGKPVGLAEFKTAEREALAATYRFFLSFCMLMTSPKTHVVEEVNFDKLNKHRVKKGKPTFSAYSRVKLSISGPITRRTGGTSSGGTSEQRGEHGEAHHGGKRLHMVNYFWRTKRGKIEFVRPHWRGNPELGTVSRKRVTA